MPCGFIHLFPESSEIIKSSPAQQVSMVTREVNILYVLRDVKGPARRRVCGRPGRESTRGDGTPQPLNICFSACSGAGAGIGAAGAAEASAWLVDVSACWSQRDAQDEMASAAAAWREASVSRGSCHPLDQRGLAAPTGHLHGAPWTQIPLLVAFLILT